MYWNQTTYCSHARGENPSGPSLLRHGLRNVALPAITLQFGSISEIIGGSVLVEQVFSYPGLGQAARHGRAWERPSAAAGDHGHHLRHRVRRQSDRRSALRSGRPEDPKEGCRTMKREKQYLEKRFSGNWYSENRRQSTILFPYRRGSDPGGSDRFRDPAGGNRHGD